MLLAPETLKSDKTSAVHLPKFLIVGAARSATTSIYHALRKHSDIFLNPSLKESNFLSEIEDLKGTENFKPLVINTIDEYSRLFQDAHECQIVGEVCVSYLYYYEKTIRNIMRHIGRNVKIVICLRNPAQRAFSNYMLHVRDGVESLSFDEALVSEPRRIRDGWWWGYHYVNVSRYTDAVIAFINAFGRESVLIILFEDFAADPNSEISKICRFLGISEINNLCDSMWHNKSGIPKVPNLTKRIQDRGFPFQILKAALPKGLRRKLSRMLLETSIARVEMPQIAQDALNKLFHDDVIRLEQSLGIPLAATWRFQR